MCCYSLPARGVFGELTPGLKCYFPKAPGCLFRCTPNGCIQLSHIFLEKKPVGIDINETSILTTINESRRTCDVVLTGDSRADLILPLVENKNIGIFQVPHHGSSSNSRLKDRRELLYYSTLQERELSKIIDREVKEIFLFYSTFRAKCYLVSAGGKYKHPHSSVLQGIILANAFQHQECIILLTNSRGLDSEKLEELHQIAPKWTRYVHIVHQNDVFPEYKCYTKLCPKECIRNVRTSTFTIEWTPEEYICIITGIISSKYQDLVDCRPLEKTALLKDQQWKLTFKGQV